MKNFNLFLIVILLSTKINAQNWSATNVSNVAYLANTGIESHQNKLYATVFNGFTAGLYCLKSTNSSWDTIQTGSITIPRFLKSAGSKLYMSSVVSGVASLLYYTVDEGKTFTLDTAGLPASFGYSALIYGLHYFNGKVFANLGAGGYYMKDTAGVKWQAIPVPTALNGGTDPIAYVNDTLFGYDNTGTNTLYVSADYGITWQVQTTDLPSGYGTNQLVGDPSTGRLYSAGAWDNSTKYGLYFSDNNGKNWTLVSNANAFMTKNAGNTQQLVTAMYANGNTFYMALENNKNSSAPDIVGTTTGLQNLAVDTLGLPSTASSATKGTNFVWYNNQLALLLNSIDIFLKQGTTGINDINPISDLNLFPNPSNGVVYLSSKQVGNNLVILNVAGEVIYSTTIQRNYQEIDLSNQAKGIYFYSIKKDSKRIGSGKIILE